MKFTNPPRWALNCAQWRDGANTQRNGALANARRAAIRADGDERQRLIRRYARDHRVSERSAEEELFGGDSDD